VSEKYQGDGAYVVNYFGFPLSSLLTQDDPEPFGFPEEFGEIFGGSVVLWLSKKHSGDGRLRLGVDSQACLFPEG
jgi:hypothetical protein